MCDLHKWKLGRFQLFADKRGALWLHSSRPDLRSDVAEALGIPWTCPGPAFSSLPYPSIFFPWTWSVQSELKYLASFHLYPPYHDACRSGACWSGACRSGACRSGAEFSERLCLSGFLLYSKNIRPHTIVSASIMVRLCQRACNSSKNCMAISGMI